MNECKHSWCYRGVYWSRETIVPWIFVALFMKPDTAYYEFICSNCGKIKTLKKKLI